jgi:hypothetical protein
MTTNSRSDTEWQILRAMTPSEKLATAYALRQTAWELAAAGVRLRNPGLGEEEVEIQVREIFLRATAT